MIDVKKILAGVNHLISVKNKYKQNKIEGTIFDTLYLE